MHREYTGVVYGEGVGCPPFIGGRVWKREEIFSFCCRILEMRILVHSPAHLRLLLHSITSRFTPPVRLPSLPFQADSGSIKGARDPAEEDTEHYLPWW